jgi:hypothetical protein
VGVVGLLIGLIINPIIQSWCSHSDGAATHDKSQVRDSNLSKEEWLHNADLFTTDCIYASLPNIQVPYTKEQREQNPQLD